MSPVLTPENVRLRKQFLPADLSFDSWSNIEPWFRKLYDAEITSVQSLEKWLLDLGELESVLHEELAWRYVRSTSNTADEAAEKAYDFFVTEIEPNTAPWFEKLNRKLIESPFAAQLDKDRYFVYLREVRNEIALYREENIPLFTKIDQLSQQYGKIAGDQSIEYNGKELTMPQAFALLRNTDPEVRKTVFEKIWKRRGEDRTKLDNLFTELAAVRHQCAVNCGFKDFRDYSFAIMGRFDYTKEDCFRFHDAIASHVVPMVNDLFAERKQKLGSLRPWDKEVDVEGKPPLTPFQGGNDLLDKALRVFGRLNPGWRNSIALMRSMGHFDLDSRKNKAPGGYNYSMPVSGAPFIFMNAADSHGDVVTMVHEAGHAFHSFHMNGLPLYGMKNPPSEVCELASMSMELITMDAWDEFYPNPDDLRRAKHDQLERVIMGLPWIACVDQFQHWLYENHGHTAEQREEAWRTIFGRFESKLVDWSGYEDIYGFAWQKQLHIFEVPFYYIEYGMAQLGAVALWREYRQDPAKAIANYETALKLGYSKPIGEIFKAAGIRFDFSGDYIHELITFLKKEMAAL
jgi:oligoendopeptidase F